VPVKVKDAIRRVEGAGWELARTRGRHRQYRHPERPGLVMIAGKPSDTLHPKTWASIVKQAGLPEQDMIAGKPSDTLHPKTWASIVKQAGRPEQDR